jgi:hypothetical protein
MPLILAIDSDRRQSEQLAALMRKSLKVELVQATSAGEGLHALHDRIPDLILTSPLLSPFDDGVLDEYLRELGTQAAHVQTVRIPVLSMVSKPSARSLFSLGKKKTPSTTPDGCDPKVFADEIAQYLARAQERRAAKTSASAVTAYTDIASAPVPDAMALAPIETVRHEEQDPIVRDFASFTAEDEEDEIPVYQPTVTIQTFDIPDEPKPIALQPREPVVLDEPIDEPIVVRPMSILNLSEPTVIERSRVIETDPEPNDPEPRSLLFDQRVDVAPAPDPIDVVQTPEPIEVVHTPEPIDIAQAPEPLLASDPLEAVTQAAAEKAPAAIPHAASASIDTSAGPSATPPRPGTAPITSFETALAAIRAAWATPSPDGTAPAKLPARPPQVEVDLTGDIDALDDVNRSTPATDGRPTSAGNTAPRSPQTRTANGKQVQDEWGMFDPNQCGFSALVDKLDEVADPQDHPARSTKVRVISVG